LCFLGRGVVVLICLKCKTNKERCSKRLVIPIRYTSLVVHILADHFLSPHPHKWASWFHLKPHHYWRACGNTDWCQGAPVPTFFARGVKALEADMDWPRDALFHRLITEMKWPFDRLCQRLSILKKQGSLFSV
jgi:hypothetical protein